MKANELRINNLIAVKGFCVKVSKETFKHIEDGKVLEAEPIPLTEQWLIKFGFEIKNGVFVLDFKKSTQGLRGDLRSDNTFSIALDEKSLLGDTESLSLITIQHVHQLQNLYFALTGKELTIKE